MADEITLPPGFRHLKPFETIQKGDLIYSHWNKNFVPVMRRSLGIKFGSFLFKTHIIRKEFVKIEYTDKQKNFIVNKLKKARAFNEDSALRIKGKNLNLYITLTQDEIIKCFGEDKFYV